MPICCVDECETQGDDLTLIFVNTQAELYVCQDHHDDFWQWHGGFPSATVSNRYPIRVNGESVKITGGERSR